MAATSSPTLAQSLRETPGSTSSFAVNDICTHAAAVAARYGQPGGAGHNRSRCLGRACRLRQCGSRRPLRVSGRPGCGTCAGRQGICGGGAVPGPAQSDPGDGRPDDEPSRAGAGYGPAAWTYREETVPGAGAGDRAMRAAEDAAWAGELPGAVRRVGARLPTTGRPRSAIRATCRSHPRERPRRHGSPLKTRSGLLKAEHCRWVLVCPDVPHRGYGRCQAQPMRSASETMIPSGPRT